MSNIKNMQKNQERRQELQIIMILSIVVSVLVILLSLTGIYHMQQMHADSKGEIAIFVFLGVFIILLMYIYVVLKKYNEQIVENEEHLKNLSQRLEFAINGTGDGLWDWNLLTNEVYFSPRWKEMLGYTDDELPNEFSSWKERVHPDDLEVTVKEILRAQEKSGMPYNGVHRLRHKDGHWVWILDRGQTIFDADGKAIRMAGFHTDITKSKLQEMEIAKLGTLLGNIINSVSNLIFVKDTEFNYIECNQAFCDFVGMPREEILGKSDYDLFDKEVADFFRQKDEEMLNLGKTKENYEWVTRPDESKIYLLTLKSPLHDEAGNILGLVGNSFDLTKEEMLKNTIKTQEEIMIAQSRHAAMGEMISMIAHQWRQPISVMAMNASNILVDIELQTTNDESLREIAKSILYQTQELSKTIDDFRDFFKPDKTASDTLVKTIVDDTLGVIGKSLENANIKIEMNVSQSLSIKTYSRELMQVLINILKNAKEAFAEHTEDEKRISIKVEETAKGVIIHVCDNASGIEKDVMQHIYEPYFTTKGIKNGTGLGLYMSKTIVEKHLQGLLRVNNIFEENTSEDKCVGACFTIELPMSIENEKY